MFHALRTLAVGATGVVAFSLAAPAPAPASAAPEATTAATASPPLAPPKAAVTDYLEDVRSELDIPGLAVLTTGPEGDATYLLGTDGEGRAVDASSRFLTGSVAKSMTATLVLLLEADGRLRLDAPVSDHVAGTVVGDTTIEELLTHRSGFTAADGLAATERHDTASDALRRAVGTLERHGSPGDYAYSSANYLVLGAVIESVTGMPFAQAAQDLLFEPLGMTSTTADPERADLPPGHQSWFGFPRAHGAEIDVAGAPAGYVATTLTDLGRYLHAQQGKQPDVLSEELLGELHAPRVKANDDRYGYGWRVRGERRDQLVHHTGATPGYFTHLLMTSDGRGAVVLANLHDESRAAALSTIGEDVLALSGPNPPSSTPAPGSRDALLSAAPWIAVGATLLGLVVGALALRRTRRTVARIALTVLAALVAVALWFAPGLLGTDWRGLRIWGPDVGWALMAAVAVWLLAAVASALSLRRRGGAATSRGGEA